MPSNSTSSPASDGQHDAHILIVDDSAPTARALAALLARAHFRSAVFHRGSDAANYAAHNRCLAALVDIHLPDMNGILLAQQLRERFGPHVPIVLLSGDTSMRTLKAATQIGATYFFSKPVNASVLRDHLCQWIADSGAAVRPPGSQREPEDGHP